MTQMRSSYCPQTGSNTPELLYTYRTVPGTPLRYYISWYVLQIQYICSPGRGLGTFTVSNLEEDHIIWLLIYYLPGRRNSHSSLIQIIGALSYNNCKLTVRGALSLSIAIVELYCRTIDIDTAVLSINYYLRQAPEIQPPRSVTSRLNRCLTCKPPVRCTRVLYWNTVLRSNMIEDCISGAINNSPVPQ